MEGSGVFEPEPEAPVEKTYEVQRPRNFRRWQPGDTFPAVEDPQIIRAIKRGAIKVVGEERVEETTPPDEPVVPESPDDDNNDGAAGASEE